MQAKKAKQLLKARLCRERQIYEMRKRAELKAAVSELERPWEVVDKPPNLFNVGADEQLKVLADRFQKPGGFDMWTQRDGPQLFQTPDELPSARFFPKGVVHSVKPYRRISGSAQLEDGGDDLGSEAENSGLTDEERPNGFRGRSSDRNFTGRLGSFSDGGESEGGEPLASGSGLDAESSSSNISNGNLQVGKKYNGRFRNQRSRRRFGSLNSRSSDGFDSGQVGSNGRPRRQNSRSSRGSGSLKSNDSKSEVYDMSLQQDGSYGFQSKNGRNLLNSKTNDTAELERF